MIMTLHELVGTALTRARHTLGCYRGINDFVKANSGAEINLVVKPWCLDTNLDPYKGPVDREPTWYNCDVLLMAGNKTLLLSHKAAAVCSPDEATEIFDDTIRKSLSIAGRLQRRGVNIKLNGEPLDAAEKMILAAGY